jgi:type 1 glutamine amidotransferase
VASRNWRSASGILLLVSLACTSQQGSTTNPMNPSGPNGTPVRVLMLTATAGFRHDSIDTARQTLSALAASTGAFTITATEDVSAIGAASLAGYDVLFFAMTSGELAFTPDQKAAILAFVARGGGFLGTHSATDTLYGWPEYGALVGAYFKEHPWTREAAVVVEDRTHPSTAMLGDRFSITEEFYTFRENPRPQVQVLLRLDASSVGGSGDYPLAWTRSHGSGRVYYNALGHFAATWQDPQFHRQITEAIQWTAGR